MPLVSGSPPSGERHAGPFGVGHQAVDRLRRHLHRFAGEHRRRIAGAFHKRHACDQRVTRQRLQRELEGLAHHAVDHQLVPGGVDVGHAGMVDGKVQAVWRDGAAKKMMRRSRMRIAELAGGVAQRLGRPFHEKRRNAARAFTFWPGTPIRCATATPPLSGVLRTCWGGVDSTRLPGFRHAAIGGLSDSAVRNQAYRQSGPQRLFRYHIDMDFRHRHVPARYGRCADRF